jgi:hypothetical protein
MSLNTIFLLPLMVATSLCVLFPVVRWMDPPRRIANAYGLVMGGAALLWAFEAAVYFVGCLGGGC